MCGRYASLASTDYLVDEFDVDEILDEGLGPSWNIAPTDPVRGITKRRPHGHDDAATPVRQLRTLRWGLVPSWANDRAGAARMINARIETVTEKPAFRNAVTRRRCLLPALGYYEWRKTDGRVIPYFLHDPTGRQVAFAGLYELWHDPARPADDPTNRLWTCTIITRAATDRLNHIHDRSPVVVPANLHDDWLDCTHDDPTHARHLLDAMPPTSLEPYPVSTTVNNVRNNGPDLIEPVTIVDPPRQEHLDLGL